MDKNEILKRNLLKRLYGEEKTATAELSGSSDEETTSCNSATKPKIYGASPAPIGYKNVKQFVEHSQDKTNDNDDSSDSDEDNTPSHGKRRRRRHRKNESKTTDKSLERGTESSAHQGLTKNQKRKLKKKRRKEKQKQHTTSVPFSYVNINEAEQKAGCTGVKKLGDSRIRGDQVKDVTEFVDAVWDLYKQDGIIKKTLSDHHNEKWNNLLSWIQGLEKSMDKDEAVHDKIKCICDIKTSLILNNKSKAMEGIKKLQDLTNDKDDTELVSFFCELMEYWMTNVMPGS